MFRVDFKLFAPKFYLTAASGDVNFMFEPSGPAELQKLVDQSVANEGVDEISVLLKFKRKEVKTNAEVSAEPRRGSQSV